MNIYIDGIWDLFHKNHLRSFKYIKEHYKGCNLIVGVISDKCAENYKRLPIINENDRCEIISSIKYISKVLFPAPLKITPDFLVKNNIDLVVHGFSNKKDRDKQAHFYKDIKKLRKFDEIPYNFGISTTEIINKIKNITNNVG